MKHILLLAMMLTLAFGSSGAGIERGRAGVGGSGTNAVAADVEGAIINRQKAQAKPGYHFVRQSSNSLAVIKDAGGVAAIQTGTLTCTGKGKTCQAYVDRDVAACNGGCYFVGARGGIRAQ
jgi:hypothetical protein